MRDDKMIICVVGPTASGKSELAVKIAKQIGGEIISADSRQIYKGLDIGAGKVEGKWRNGKFIYKGVAHYLIDEASPRVQYSVARFQKKAHRILSEIFSRGKVPIICGGTGYWIDVIAFEHSLPEVKPNSKLRAELERKTTAEMFTMLMRVDPARAKSIDSKNPRRLIRALEIVKSTGKPVPKIGKINSLYKVVWIGLNPGRELLESKIQKRLKERLKNGMVNEVKNLHKQGVSWKRLEAFGLEYKFVALFLQGKLSLEEMESQLYAAIRKYAKRQMTWWKSNKNIRWYADAKSVPAKLV